MLRFYIIQKEPLTLTQLNELNTQFSHYNIPVSWETNDIINVDGAYESKLSSILEEQYIPYTTKLIDVPFADIQMKRKLDNIYKLAIEILNEVEEMDDIYLLEEKETFDILNRMIYTYETYFTKKEIDSFEK